MREPILCASLRSSGAMSLYFALGVSSLQKAARHFEMPTQEQLNSPTIHFSSALAVPGGEELMKSVVHHNGIGSLASPRDGITSGRSVVKKFFVRFAKRGS